MKRTAQDYFTELEDIIEYMQIMRDISNEPENEDEYIDTLMDLQSLMGELGYGLSLIHI